MKRTLIAFLAVALLALGGLTVANAATLNVNAGRLATITTGPCASLVMAHPTEPGGFLGLGFKSLTFNLSGTPGCVGLPIQVTVVDSYDGTAVASGSVTSQIGTSVRVPMAGGTYFYTAYMHGLLRFYEARYSVTINGWNVLVTVS